jgi:predicted DNA-binding transcriptional regulator AlpA
MGKQFLAKSEFATTTEKGGKPTGASSAQLIKLTFQTSIFDALPDSAFIRESQLVQSPKRPKNPAPLPFSAPTLWRKVKAGTFPRPVKLSERVTAWNVGSIRDWLNAQSKVDAA